MTNFAIITAIVLAVVLFVWLKLRSAQKEIEQVLKTNADLTEQNSRLQAQKAVAETQVKNHQTRKQNEENISSSSRDSIINELQQNSDLRSDE